MRRFIAVLLLCAAAQISYAQPENLPPVSANTPITGTLTGDGPVEYAYTAGGEETVTVSVRRLVEDDTFDLTLEVLNDARVRLAFNDDHGSERADLAPHDSLIDELELPGAGTYIIRVNTFRGVSEGEFELLVANENGDSAEPAAQATPEVSESAGGDETITGNVPDNEAFTYEFEAAAGEVVTITVRSLDFELDPKVALLDSDGRALASNDDHSTDDTSLGRFDSRISDFSIPEAGTYTIEITGFGGVGGDFELTIERGGSSPEPRTVTQTTTSGDIQSIEAETEDGAYAYNFEATAGDVFTFTAISDSDRLDVDLAVYDDAGDLVASNYEHGSSDPSLSFYDARISNLIIQDTGDYQVQVFSYDTETVETLDGGFTLTIEPVMEDAPLGAGTEQFFVAEITANSTFRQTFEAEAGDFVTITVRSLTDGFDPLVDLLSPGGVLLANNDDHGSGSRELGRFDSRITRYIIPEAGTYTVEVGGYRDTSGGFGVTITTVR